MHHLIEIRDIAKDYLVAENTVNAIRQMDFHVDDGEFIRIMGQSGSGKSTLLALLGGRAIPWMSMA